MREDLTLLAVSVHKLADKVQEQKMVTAIERIDNGILVSYKGNINQKIKFPKQTQDTLDLEALKDNVISSISDRINKDIKSNFNTIKKKLDQDVKKHSDDIYSVFNDLKNSIPEPEQKQDYSQLINELDGKINDAIKSIPIITNDQKIDEEYIVNKITTDFNSTIEEHTKKLDQTILSELEKGIANIPAPQKGEDGKNADEAKITSDLLKELKQLLEIELSNLKTQFNQKILQIIDKQKEDLVLLLTKNMAEFVALLPKPKDGIDGINGINGVDADELAIEARLLDKLNSLILFESDKVKSELLALIKETLQSLKATVKNIKAERGREGEKGEKGDKGKDGNGIIDAKINSNDHLIIKTDEKTIDAGKVSIKKYYGGGGATNPNPTPSDFLYTNELLMSKSVGMIPKGTKFKDVDLKTLFTKLLYGYDFPRFTLFLIGDIPTQLEIGRPIFGRPYLTEFTIENPQLLRPNSISVLKDGVVLLDNIPNEPTVDVPIDGFVSNVPVTINFEVSAYDTTGISFNKYYPVNYQYRIYYGEYTEDITDSGGLNPLNVLRATDLVSDINGEYLFLNIPLGANYKWFCFPSALGENYVFYDITSDIAIVMDDVVKVNIVNEYNLDIEYNCYRTLNETHEDIIIKIKDGF